MRCCSVKRVAIERALRGASIDLIGVISHVPVFRSFIAFSRKPFMPNLTRSFFKSCDASRVCSTLTDLVIADHGHAKTLQRVAYISVDLYFLFGPLLDTTVALDIDFVLLPFNDLFYRTCQHLVLPVVFDLTESSKGIVRNDLIR